MNDVFSHAGPFPPSLEGQPALTFATVMFLWLVTLLALQWIYAVVEDTKKYPMPLRSTATAARAVKVSMLIILLVQSAPRLLMVMAWHRLSPEWREAWALSSWLVYIPCGLVFAAAWWVDRIARPAERQALHYSKIYRSPSIAWDMEKKRGIYIVLAVIVVAFTTTFIRPEPNVAPSYSIGRAR